MTHSSDTQTSSEATAAAVRDRPTPRSQPTSRAAGRPARVVDRLLAETPPRLLELVFIAVVLTLIAGAAYADRVAHAGFVTDDWSLRKSYLWWTRGDGNFFDFVAHAGFQARPALGVYLGIVQGTLGFHQGMYLGLAVAQAIGLSLSVYLLLRTLRLAPLHAGIIAVFTLVFPGSNSVRLWAITGDASWTMTLLALGVVLTLRSFDARGRRAVLLRVGGLALYALSLLTYEIGTLLLACSIVVYRCRVGWRPALKAWALDLATVALVFLLVLRKSPSQRLSTSETLDHTWDIVRGAFELFATTAVPFTEAVAPVLVVAVLILVAALVVWRRSPPGEIRTELGRWLATIGVAAVVVAAGYAIFAPGLRIYVPMAQGLENRINALPGLGLVTIVYALGALLATLAFRRATHRRVLTAVATAAFGVLVAGFYFDATRADVERWDTAYVRAQQTLSLMLERMPKPPPGSMVVSFGQPVWEAAGVPVWATSWDLDGAVAVRYGDVTLAAMPAYPGTTVACGPDSAIPSNPGFPGAYLPSMARPYGRLYLFDARRGKWSAPRNRGECERVTPQFVAGPWQLPPAS